MSKLRRTIGKKATKATVSHSVHGVAAKAKRKPLRAVTLLGLGGAIGAGLGWTLARKA